MNYGEKNVELSEKEIKLLRKKIEVELLKKEAEIIQFWKKDIDRIYKKTLDPKSGMSDLQYEIKAILERMTNRLEIINRMIREMS